MHNIQRQKAPVLISLFFIPKLAFRKKFAKNAFVYACVQNQDFTYKKKCVNTCVFDDG